MRRACTIPIALTCLLLGSCKHSSKPAPPEACELTTYPATVSSQGQLQSLTSLVNPMVGTTNGGNAIPGALVPHGAVRLSPDTNRPSGNIAAYDYSDSQIIGFTHTHLEGDGGSAYGYSNVLVMPTRGTIDLTNIPSTFSHSTETAQPGYYAVDLTGPNVHAELTATRLCGVHRYTFNGSGPGNILIDGAHTQGEFLNGQVEIAGPQTVTGSSMYDVDPLLSNGYTDLSIIAQPSMIGQKPLFFYAVFSQPFDSSGTWSGTTVQSGVSSATSTSAVGAYVTYANPTQPIEVSICLSSISEAQAQANYMDEVSGQDFDAVHTAADTQWNSMLNRIQVQGGTSDQQTLFYTGLYRSYFQPADYSEGCQFWSGENQSGAVLQTTGWHYYTDDWCMWDTYRTVHPLQMLLDPARESDIVQSMLVGYEQGGWVSKCSWDATGYSRVMTAIPFAPIIADAYVKGFQDYDAGEAMEAMMKAATQEDPTDEIDGMCGYINKGTPPDFAKLGYVSHDCDPRQSASMTLEYSFEDWSLAQMAKAMGNTQDEAQLMAAAANYKNVFNPDAGFMQGKTRAGDWVEPFDPTSSTDFTEGSSWIYTWMVPHDVQGLITLMGGPAAFTSKLDEFFEGGHSDPSNEPGFQAPYLYNYAGAPSHTATQVRSILSQDYTNAPGGLPGNDDSGAMSSYYVWGMLGLYPITPGDDTLLIGSPQFDQATIYLDSNYYSGKTFVIQTVNNGPDATYVQSATLNGMPLTQNWIRFQDVIAGGTLVVTMGTEPSTWGTDPSSVPPSMSTSPQ